MLRHLALATTLALATPATHADWSLINVLETPATTPDALRLPNGVEDSANLNRFGFYSDLAYDQRTRTWYALSDRGPGGGLIDYATRVQRLTIPFDKNTGAIGQPRILLTTLFTGPRGAVFNGLNPRDLNGDAAELGMSFDPEGLAVGPGGRLFVADEYGPSIYEFTRSGRFVRAFTMPANLLPVQADSQPNYVDGRPTIAHGRQDNRGFEGLTFNASRTRLYAVMQDPLVDEGSQGDGRRSRNVRAVEFDPRSGTATAQYVYRLAPREVLNAMDPSEDDDFSASNQGRSIGLSAITALSDFQFLVIERDNRGLGVEVTATPRHKRVYRIDLRGATDVSARSLAGSDGLPAGGRAVAKAPEVDLLAALRARGLTVPEKIEGIAIGPRLADGRFLVLIGTDNDYSVTQTGEGEQFEVCVNRTDGARAQVPLDADCPAGTQRIPGMLMAFAVDFD